MEQEAIQVQRTQCELIGRSFDSLERAYGIKGRNIIAFACNANHFANAIIFFFLFLIPSAVFGQTTKSFLTNVLRLVSSEACNQDLTHSLDIPKSIYVKIVPEVVILDACGT